MRLYECGLYSRDEATGGVTGLNPKSEIIPQKSTVITPPPKKTSTVIVRLILSKISKVVATRCHNLKLKCNQIRFRLWPGLRPRWGSLQRSIRPPSWI